MMLRTQLRAAALIAMTAALLFAAGCKKRQQEPAQLLPAGNEVAGWDKTAETKTYTPETLSDYIDGGAEEYLSAGFRSASTSDYKFQNKIEAVADVYQMASPEAAKKVFEADPAGNSKTAPIGDAARVFSQSVVFRKGAYLVRITGYQDAPETQQALTQLAQGIDKRISK
jgi:hypothetical protein